MRPKQSNRGAGELFIEDAVVLLIFQAALVAFIAGGVLAIATVYVIRRRTVSYRHKIDPTLGSLGQMGMVPPTPLPEWVHWEESK